MAHVNGRWIRCGLVLALALCGCKSRSAAPAPSATASSRAPPPAWLEWQRETVRLHAAERTKAPRPPFARVGLEIRSARPAPACDGPCKQTSYVRVETRSDGLYVLPQCSAPGEAAPVFEQISHGAPYRLRSGKLEAGSFARLDGVSDAHLTLKIEDWWQPGPPPAGAWDTWLYSRSLTVSNARRYGFAVDVFAGQGCDPSEPYDFEACRATLGGPLSMLMDPRVQSFLDDRPLGSPPKEQWWLRTRVLSPVVPDAFHGFAGRNAYDFIHLDCNAVQKRMKPFIESLAADGVSVERLMAGSALTFGGQYYPQAPVVALATVARCAGLDTSLARELERLDQEPGLDWQNRFRIAVLLDWLRSRDRVVPTFRRFVPELSKAQSDGGNADERCIEGLLGPPSLRSAG